MKKEKRLRIFIDGGSRGDPGHGACAAVFLGADGAVLREESRYLGRCADALAGYNGLSLALASAARMGAEELEIFSDSRPLLKQYDGERGAENAAQAALLAGIRQAAAGFRKVTLAQVSREKNRAARRLVNLLLDNARNAPPALDRSLAAENSAPLRKKRF